jgi:uncharacterized protein
MPFTEQIYLLLVALAANFLSALAGGGAGLLQLPALLLLGLPFATAMATHKIATVALGLGASWQHLRNGTTDWRFAGFILLAGLPGVLLGAVSLLHLPEQTAKIALGLLTLALGIYSAVQPQLGLLAAPRRRDLRGWLWGALGLFLIGVLNGALASGTGLFVTLFLVVWFGLDYKQAVAYTMILVGIFWNGSGALALSAFAPPQWDWLPVLLLGSVVGGYLGTRYAQAKGNRFIKRAFEILTALVGIWLIASAL